MTLQFSKVSAVLVIKILLLALAYYIGGKLGLGLPYVGSSITLFWPSSGIALAALLIGGITYCPGIFLGALAINLTTGDLHPLVALGISSGNTLGPVLGMLLLKRKLRFQSNFK